MEYDSETEEWVEVSVTANVSAAAKVLKRSTIIKRPAAKTPVSYSDCEDPNIDGPFIIRREPHTQP